MNSRRGSSRRSVLAGGARGAAEEASSSLSGQAWAAGGRGMPLLHDYRPALPTRLRAISCGHHDRGHGLDGMQSGDRFCAALSPLTAQPSTDQAPQQGLLGRREDLIELALQLVVEAHVHSSEVVLKLRNRSRPEDR